MPFLYLDLPVKTQSYKKRYLKNAEAQMVIMTKAMLATHILGNCIFCPFAKVSSFTCQRNLGLLWVCFFCVCFFLFFNRTIGILLWYVNFFLKGLGKCIYIYYKMIVHFDLLWNTNSPGESIRFILMKRISSKYVGQSNNNKDYYFYILIFACWYLLAQTCFWLLRKWVS